MKIDNYTNTLPNSNKPAPTVGYRTQPAQPAPPAPTHRQSGGLARGGRHGQGGRRRTRGALPLATLIGAVVALLALTATLTGCGPGEPQAAEPPRAVRWVEVSATPPTDARTFTGRTRAGSESRVGPRIAGTVLEISVDTGDRVAAGEVIARLDPEPIRLERDAAATQLAAARAQLAHARAAHERVQRLFEQDLASRSEFDAARTALETAESQKAGAERRLELADLQLSYTEVRSPFAGRVSARLADSGENIAAGHPLVMLVSEDRWEVQVSVPDSVAIETEVGDTVQVHLPAVSAETLAGTVSGVGGGVAQAAGTYPVTIQLNAAGNPQILGRLKSGMITRVSFPLPERVAMPTIRVPSPAVGEDREGHYVYVLVVNEEETADWNGQEIAELKRRTVTPGRLLQDEIEILSGLRDGDRVVTLGLNHLSDGMAVRPLENGGRR